MTLSLSRSLSLVLVVLASGCGPRLAVRRELPARIELGAQTRALTVVNAHRENVLSVALDPIGALTRTTLTPYAVNRLERALSRGPRYQVVVGCGAYCPAADGAVELEVINARVNPGDAVRKEARQVYATVRVRIITREGRLAFTDDYGASRTGSVPGEKGPTDADLFTWAVAEAVDDFVGDLYPQWISESFPIEKEGALEPVVKAAASGDLDGAERIIRAVLEAQPSNAMAIYDLGVIFTARGQLEQARDAFAAAAAIDPRYTRYARAAEQRIVDRHVLRSQSR